MRPPSHIPPFLWDPPCCSLLWFPHRSACPSQLCSRCRPWRWSRKFPFHLRPGCRRLCISARSLQQGTRSQTRIGRRSSEMACSFTKPRGAESYPLRTGSLGGTTVARTMAKTRTWILMEDIMTLEEVGVNPFYPSSPSSPTPDFIKGTFPLVRFPSILVTLRPLNIRQEFFCHANLLGCDRSRPW